MAWGYGVPAPKPQPRIVDRMAAKKAADQQAKAFRAAVWLRDGSKCRHCGVRVMKSLSLTQHRGEVHHRRGRNVAPEDRYNVDAAVLLCAMCHWRATRHEITIR